MESQQEKLHFQLARIHEINAHLRALMDASDQGLPTHMNLAIRGSFAAQHDDATDRSRTLDRLKQQNKLLTEVRSNNLYDIHIYALKSINVYKNLSRA